jgi:tetratricopeptide (TPR) repeat protein
MRTALLCLVVAAHPFASDRALVSETAQMTLRGEWDAAIARLEAAIADARSDRVQDAVLRTELGRVLADRNFFHRADVASAKRALNAALGSAKRAGHQPSIADVTQYLGQLLFAEALHSQDWEKPRQRFLRAIALRERLHDERGLSQSYFYLGLIYEQQKPPQNDVALEHYRHSLALSTNVGDKVLQSYAYRHIGGIQEDRGELDAAFRDISQSLHLRRQGQFTVGVPYAILQKANFIAQHYGRRNEAMGLLQEAIEVAASAHSTRARSETEAALARLTMEAGDARGAVSLLNDALAHAREFGDSDLVRATEKQLGDARPQLEAWNE